MGYTKNLINALRKSFLLTDNSVVDTFRDFWEMTAGAKETTALIEACTNTMGNYYSSARFRLYKRDSNGILREKYDHPFLDIMAFPNEFQTWWEQKYLIAVHQVFFGNAYLLKLRDGMGVWRQQIFLNPAGVRVISSSTKFVDHYEYTVNGKTISYDSQDIIHIRYPSGKSQILGAPLISALGDQIDIDKYQTALQKRFYQNGGFWGSIFSTNQALNKTSYDHAYAQLKERATVDGSFKFGLFDGGLTPVKAGYSIKDMEIADQRKLTREEILSTFRIPQIMIGGASDTYNRASAEAGAYLYASTFVDPMLAYIDETFTRNVKMEFGSNFGVKHDTVSPKDVQNALTYYEKGIQSGFLTRNEVRIAEDYEPIEIAGGYMDKPTDSVGGALVDLTNGEQLGQTPNNVPPKNNDNNNSGKQ